MPNCCADTCMAMAGIYKHHWIRLGMLHSCIHPLVCCIRAIIQGQLCILLKCYPGSFTRSRANRLFIFGIVLCSLPFRYCSRRYVVAYTLSPFYSVPIASFYWLLVWELCELRTLQTILHHRAFIFFMLNRGT